MSPRKNRLFACTVAGLMPIADVEDEFLDRPFTRTMFEVMLTPMARAVIAAAAFATKAGTRQQMIDAKAPVSKWYTDRDTLFTQAGLVARSALGCCRHTANTAAKSALVHGLEASRRSFGTQAERMKVSIQESYRVVEAGRLQAWRLSHSILDDISMPDTRPWFSRSFHGDVVRMARSVESTMTPLEMAVLADAIEEYHGDEEDAQQAALHCRTIPRHHAGCWVVDWLLGRA